MDNIDHAKRVLEDNTNVLYGIFGIISGSGCFPPLLFLNEFFLAGSDPCDQDGTSQRCSFSVLVSLLQGYIMTLQHFFLPFLSSS